eukprot:TRINITY_DN7584_c0_g1_i1.p1 TRINITY_DN7584_c0_g1~~TRINITY_DN7584_c0_g1_i1.p1  ORF type:complete len:891 (+),score=348.35 TRINITY_DN7584_c0_g1_i1:80-2752(+)
MEEVNSSTQQEGEEINKIEEQDNFNSASPKWKREEGELSPVVAYLSQHRREEANDIKTSLHLYSDFSQRLTASYEECQDCLDSPSPNNESIVIDELTIEEEYVDQYGSPINEEEEEYSLYGISDVDASSSSFRSHPSQLKGKKKKGEKKEEGKKENGILKVVFGKLDAEKNEKHRNWNEEFQSYRSDKHCAQKSKNLKGLASDFGYAASTYGRIIITENSLPIERKTIKPVEIGGIAGGQKFIVSGILFKFCIDSHGIYEGDNNAMKAASHELKGLEQYLRTEIDELCVPLMAFIDYRGWRLQAVSLLPIKRESLIYGSEDGGRKVSMSDNVFNNLMLDASKFLNLKPHFVGQAPNLLEIASCCDIEGHQGSDGRYYLLDFARVAPAHPPNKRGENLYKLFRFEFLADYEKPLSSDVFSGMGSHNAREHNNEARKAFEYLTESIIPSFSQKIDSKFQSCPISIEEFLCLLHENGINYRLMGMVRNKCKNVELRNLILEECIARVCKMHLEEIFREISRRIGSPSNEPYVKGVTNLLNLISGDEKYWKLLQFDLEEKFENVLVGDNSKEKLIDRVYFNPIISRFLNLTNITYAQSPPEGCLRSRQYSFMESAVLNIGSRVKQSHLIHDSTAMSFYMESKTKYCITTRVLLLTFAMEEWRKSLRSLSSGKTAFNLANCLVDLAEIDQSKDYLEEAFALYGSVLRSKRFRNTSTETKSKAAEGEIRVLCLWGIQDDSRYSKAEIKRLCNEFTSICKIRARFSKVSSRLLRYYTENGNSFDLDATETSLDNFPTLTPGPLCESDNLEFKSIWTHLMILRCSDPEFDRKRAASAFEELNGLDPILTRELLKRILAFAREGRRLNRIRSVLKSISTESKLFSVVFEDICLFLQLVE